MWTESCLCYPSTKQKQLLRFRRPFGVARVARVGPMTQMQGDAARCGTIVSMRFSRPVSPWVYNLVQRAMYQLVPVWAINTLDVRTNDVMRHVPNELLLQRLGQLVVRHNDAIQYGNNAVVFKCTMGFQNVPNPRVEHTHVLHTSNLAATTNFQGQFAILPATIMTFRLMDFECVARPAPARHTYSLSRSALGSGARGQRSSAMASGTGVMQQRTLDFDASADCKCAMADRGHSRRYPVSNIRVTERTEDGKVQAIEYTSRGHFSCPNQIIRVAFRELHEHLKAFHDQIVEASDVDADDAPQSPPTRDRPDPCFPMSACMEA